MQDLSSIVLIGYSGHSYVLVDILASTGKQVLGYCEKESKSFNPYNLTYYGTEMSQEGLKVLRENDYFIAIGNNNIRQTIQSNLDELGIHNAINAIHKSAIIGSEVKIGSGVMIGQNAVINAHAKIGDGTVCNTSSIIEHEVRIGDFSFIAPGATLLGGVQVGNNTFIGANATILQNVKIGNNCTIGAGSVVLNDIPSDSKVVGNPHRII